METAWSSETLVTYHLATWYHKSEDRNVDMTDDLSHLLTDVACHDTIINRLVCC
jgi:hypothetical protein